MENNSWENNIILPATKREFDVLLPAIQYATQEHYTDISTLNLEKGINEYLKNDTSPLPTTEDREGYYDDRHYDFWLSGLADFIKISKSIEKHGVKLSSKSRVLDFGCATGRVLRHFNAHDDVESWGCDINENHVIWSNKHLPKAVNVFHCTSLPHLQVEDSFFDLIYCLSVFTHIEAFETSWLCELRRITKPNGIVYLTIHDETSWENMPKDWGVGHALLNHPDFEEKWLVEGFPNEKFISRYFADKSYSSNVFYKLEYIKKVWGKFFDIKEIIPMGSLYQTVLILQKHQ